MLIPAKGVLFAIMAAAAWGVVYALHNVALDKISPMKLLLMGGILDVLVLGPVFILRGERLFDGFSGDTITSLAVAGSILLALVSNLLILTSIQEVGASMAAVLEICYPVFTVLVLALFFGERVGPRFVIGAALVFVGVCVIVTRSESPDATMVSTESPDTVHVAVELPDSQNHHI